MIFREKVRQAREELKLSQEEMAHWCIVLFATINCWENGHNHPAYETLQRFEKFCSCKGIINGLKVQI